MMILKPWIFDYLSGNVGRKTNLRNSTRKANADDKVGIERIAVGSEPVDDVKILQKIYMYQYIYYCTFLHIGLLVTNLIIAAFTVVKITFALLLLKLLRNFAF